MRSERKGLSARDRAKVGKARSLNTKSVRDFLESEDPLSPEAFEYLVDYREEDSLIDYKASFDPKEERDWLEITKDIMAFANTRGGYLIFGVRDRSFELVGVNPEIVGILTDSNQIIQKLNRFVDPPIGLLRSKSFVRDGKHVVAVFIPMSVGITHIISKDGNFRYATGREKIVLRKGTLYVRRSAGNQLVDARDLDDIIRRRMDQFRESLLSKIARVVEAPPESEVLVFSPEPGVEPHKRFIIDDAPDAIPIKGMSFTVAPTTTEQAVAAWIAMTSGDQHGMPASSTLWEWYETRATLKLSEKQRIGVAKFCVQSDVPLFYWLQDCNAQAIKPMLLDAISIRRPGTQVERYLQVASFLGERFYGSAILQLGDYASKLAQRMKKYPTAGPRSRFQPSLIESRRRAKFKGTEAEFRAQLEAELNEIAASVRKNKKEQPGVMERWTAWVLDCYLYAQDDQYMSVRT